MTCTTLCDGAGIASVRFAHLPTCLPPARRGGGRAPLRLMMGMCGRLFFAVEET